MHQKLRDATKTESASAEIEQVDLLRANKIAVLLSTYQHKLLSTNRYFNSIFEDKTLFSSIFP